VSRLSVVRGRAYARTGRGSNWNSLSYILSTFFLFPVTFVDNSLFCFMFSVTYLSARVPLPARTFNIS